MSVHAHRLAAVTRREPRSSPSGGAARALATLAVIALTALLVVVTLAGLWWLALAAAGFVLALAALGRTRMITVAMMLVFATSPVWKGIASSPSAPITPTDVLLILAILLLVPDLLQRRLPLPALYVAGVLVLLVTGVVSSTLSEVPSQALINVVQWMFALVVVPCAIVIWSPSLRMIDVLLWCFVGGQMISLGYGLVSGPTAGTNRYQGLSHHPNAFAEAALVSVAMLLYLWFRHRSLVARLVIVACGLAGAEAIALSGSRSAAVVLAALIVMVPFVERSAVSGFAVAIGGSLAVLGLMQVVGTDVAGSGNVIARLAGQGDAAAANEARSSALADSFEFIRAHPLLGNGYTDTILVLHDNFTEVFAAAGLIGFLGYVAAMYPLARPLFGTGPHRRLSYVVWVYLGLGVAIPSLWDRTLWVPIGLAMMAAVGSVRSTVPKRVPVGTVLDSGDHRGARVSSRNPTSRRDAARGLR
ncbi:O-antigen ligase family protein [Nocardioides sp. Kera G14]|uniref:O-antigen ligase family protein n=1 Tax=Nocardioides sp. Kera G14 TaxID=2884264 RepID=UPI001D129A70|nr:O-antigen ligase family protein [Nocardioides sp. Kera G14]UDY23611.1 O-antigen ligase family protein [Nocardioides sp. Kera G14]